MTRRRRLPWFRLGKGRNAWRVYLVDRIFGEAGELVGVCHYETRTIEVAAWQPFDEICHTTLHELLHAWAGSELHDEVADLAEERFILRVEQRAFDGLTALGMRLPHLPDGFDALRERAIAAQKEPA